MYKDLVGLDSRFFRTVGPLLFRPGRLAAEYLSGRREPYAPPLRTYILASATFFGFAALSGEPIGQVQIDSIDPVSEAKATALFNAGLSYMHFFLMPLLAVFLMALFRRPRRYFLEHLVFALYYGASAFLLVLLALGLGALVVLPWGEAHAGVARSMAIVIMGALFLYLVLALRRVYGRSWPATIFRATALSVLYLVTFGLGAALLVLLAYLYV